MPFLYAFLGGLLPSLLWLYIVLKEDSRCPEPRKMVALAFVVGMLAVPIVIPGEEYAASKYADGSLMLIFVWALIEETAKYAVAALFILWRRSVDESIDYVIYMITIALGFAALENAFFLFGPFANGQFHEALLTENMRFIGSTLAHVLSSATIGFAMAFSWNKTPGIRVIYSVVGLILAVALHTVFNFLILYEGGVDTLAAFFTVWIGAVVLFALFEILKYIRYDKLPKNTC